MTSSGRSNSWLKVKLVNEQEFTIIGFQPSAKGRAFASLMLADKVGGKWRYRGNVGTGFNDKTWLDYEGHPHSDQLHLVERIHRTSHDTLVNDITIEDPKAYTKPWVSHMVFDLKPEWKIEETICEDNVNFSNVQKISESSK